MNQSEIYIDKLLEQFLPSGDWSVRTGASGRNNTTRFVASNGRRYVLRIYQTHKDECKVNFEHRILTALREICLPFHTPEPVQALPGGTIAKAGDGKIAALFSFIDGVNPSLDDPVQLRSFGWAAGHLTCALKDVQSAGEPAYRPYYEIENTHPLCSPEEVILFCKNPSNEFLKHAPALIQIGEELAILQENTPKLKRLPHQLIHGDLNASNVLVNDKGQISAILDFEFVTNDLSVMELAVCLSDLISSVETEALLWSKIDAFLAGYGDTIKLTQDEIDVIPLLIKLRRLDVFIHFLGRYRDGIDKMDIVEDQIHNAAEQVNWLNDNENRLMDICQIYLYSENTILLR